MDIALLKIKSSVVPSWSEIRHLDNTETGALGVAFYHLGENGGPTGYESLSSFTFLEELYGLPEG